MTGIMSLKPSGSDNRIRLLGSENEKGPTIITDPFGGNNERYDITYNECSNAITSFFSKLL